jgi:hypothetical protein
MLRVRFAFQLGTWNLEFGIWNLELGIFFHRSGATIATGALTPRWTSLGH